MRSDGDMPECEAFVGLTSSLSLKGSLMKNQGFPTKEKDGENQNDYPRKSVIAFFGFFGRMDVFQIKGKLLGCV